MKRADFYIGLETPRWVGTFLDHGGPEDVPYEVLMQVNEVMFVEVLDDILRIFPFGRQEDDGWPHQWADSQMTDYVYYFHKGKVYMSMMDEGQHTKIFDPVIIKQEYDLRKAYKCTMVPKFPSMRWIARYKEFNGQFSTKIV